MSEKKYKLDEELLRQAFLEAANQEREEYEAMESPLGEGSEAHQRKMERLIRSRRRGWWKYVNTAAKRAAVIVAALLVLCSCAMSVKAIREPVIRAIVYVYETFTSLFFECEEDEDTAPLKPCTLQTVPEGYVEKEKLMNEAMVRVFWENDQGQWIRLQQTPKESHAVVLDNESAEMKVHTVRGLQLYIQVSKSTEAWNWVEGNSAFYLVFPTELHDEFMEQMKAGTLLKWAETDESQ